MQPKQSSLLTSLLLTNRPISALKQELLEELDAVQERRRKNGAITDSDLYDFVRAIIKELV